jgi:hypothetical protein
MTAPPRRLPLRMLFPLVCLAALLGAPAAARAVPKVDVDISSHTFPGTVMVGHGSAELQFRVSSVGTDVLRLWKWRLTGAHPDDFVVAGCGFFQPPGNPMDLQPGQWCPGQVGFRPTAPGQRTATLEIVSSDPTRPQILIPLLGNASASAPDLQVTPLAVPFGLVPLNAWSAPRVVTVSSVGSAPLTVTSISVADPLHFSVTQYCTGVMAPATSCSVEVKFRPGFLTLHQSRLTIVSDDPQGVVEIPLSGTGGAPHLDSVPLLDFGTGFTGSPSVTLGLVVRNVTAPGMGHLHVTGVGTSGPQAADFRITSLGTCADVPEGASCTLTVVFAPRGSGPSSAELLITSDTDGVAGSVRGVLLRGTGLFFPLASPPPVPGVSPSFSDVQFVGPGSPTTCAASGTAGVSVFVNVTRAFGSRNPGFPATPQPTVAAAVGAGTMAPLAKLELMVFHQGPASQHGLAFDFPPIPSGAITAPAGVWSLQTVHVPVDLIRFPTVTAPGATPTRTNVLYVTPDQTGAGSCVSVAWARITIKAASPVILVHGDGSDGAFFARQGLTRALSAAGIPSDSSVNLAGGGSVPVSANAATLQARLPAIVRSFGVNSVHLVTHSKGGLDARLWLSANATGNAAAPFPFRVLSMTTLGTPHRGSPLADLQLAVAGGAMIGGLPVGATALFGLSPGGGSTLDLTTFAGLAFNPPLPTGADYQMIAADADADRDLTIRSAPVDEYAPARSEQAMLASLFAGDAPGTDALVTGVYRFLLTTQTVIPIPVPVPIPFLPGATGMIALPIAGPTPMPNDLLVRSDSALGAPAPFVPALGSPVPFDHAGVAGTAVGAAIVPLVIATDRLRGDLR